MAKKSEVKESMLSREDIEKAIEESQHVKEQYPAFWKFYEMLIDMNHALSIVQESMEDKDGNSKKR